MSWNIKTPGDYINGPLTVVGDVTIGSNAFKIDSVNKRVGVNTATTSTGGGQMVVEHANNNGLVINSTGGSPTIYLRNTADANPAKLFFSDNGLTFANVTNGTLATLNSTGFGLGVAPELKFRVNGPDEAPATSGTSTSNGALRIGGANTNLCIDSGVCTTGGIYGWFQSRDRSTYASNYDLVLQKNGGNVGIGVVPIGGKGCLQLSSGINFPATQVASTDANTLDDYEEGTWTPSVAASSGTPTTVTIGTCKYTKIGRQVICTFDFTVVDKGTASGSFIFSLPFTSDNFFNCGAFRENGSVGNMGQVFRNSAGDAAMFLYHNITVWVNTYKMVGTYTYCV